ncbi:MAG TPA: anti-sigma factor [Vicinamibacterales bacterium]|nr:anti-sigma factor [Vicinamibacterales bacterium]
MICIELEQHLDSYLDHEIAADTAAVVREHLRTCFSCRQRVADREAVGRLVRSMPYYEAPDRLHMHVSTQVRRIRFTRHLFAWAAAAVFVVSVGGVISLVLPATGDDRTAGDVVDGHVRSLMAGHLFDVRSTDQHMVKPWFLGKLDFSPPVVDLASAGFPLVGGRLDYVSGRPVAALVYQRQQHTINVFISPTSSDRPNIGTWTLRGFQVRHWVRDRMSHWAVSDLNDIELSEFVAALRRM